MSLKNEVEAILYSIGGKISVEDMCKLTKRTDNEVKVALEELQKDYESRDTSLMIAQENDEWKLVTKETYSKIVRKIVSEIEMPKAVLETLAVIAWKQPVMQSDVINERTANAYEHIKLLEDGGFISKESFGRTYILKTTEKFANYFEIEGGEDIRKLLEKAREKHEKKILKKKLMEEKIQKVKDAQEKENQEVKDSEEGSDEVVEETKEETEQETNEETQEEEISEEEKTLDEEPSDEKEESDDENFEDETSDEEQEDETESEENKEENDKNTNS